MAIFTKEKYCNSAQNKLGVLGLNRDGCFHLHQNKLTQRCLRRHHGACMKQPWGHSAWCSKNIKYVQNLIRFFLVFIWLPWVLVVAHGIFAVACRVFVGAHQLSCSKACGILVPQPGIKPVSPITERWTHTGPPCKSSKWNLDWIFVKSKEFNSPED